MEAVNTSRANKLRTSSGPQIALSRPRLSPIIYVISHMTVRDAKTLHFEFQKLDRSQFANLQRTSLHYFKRAEDTFTMPVCSLQYQIL
jgi:hypothetical protein